MNETIDKKAYSLIPKFTENHARFSLVFTDGFNQQEQYADLHGALFAADGTSIVLHIAYSPPIKIIGNNLLKLEPYLRKCEISYFEAYSQDYHASISDNEEPIITDIEYQKKKEK